MFDMFFFFQAEDGIRDYKVTGVQTCALPILDDPPARLVRLHPRADLVERELEQAQIDDVAGVRADLNPVPHLERAAPDDRSEEHTSELQSPCNLVCRLLLEKKKK